MINWARRKYTPEQFKKAWFKSNSIRQVALNLGLDARGDAYRVIRRAAEDLKLNSAHMTGYLGSSVPHRTTKLEDLLVEKTDYTNFTYLKKRVLKMGLLNEKCYICGITEYRGIKIPFCLDHISGDKSDSRIENLRLLCPNCDSQQPTYRGRNKGH